jgi:hypothetical protein
VYHKAAKKDDQKDWFPGFMVKERPSNKSSRESTGNGKVMKDFLWNPPAIGSCLRLVNSIEGKESRGEEYIPNAEKF